MVDLSTNHVQSKLKASLKARLPAAAREMSPRSSPESTAGLVSLKLSRQFGLRPGMADDVKLINDMRENLRSN